MSDRVATGFWIGSASQRRYRGWFLGVILLTAVSWGVAPGQEARPADSLCGRASREKLFVVPGIRRAGLIPTPGTGSAAYKLLTETKLGTMLEDLAGQGLEMAFARGAARSADQAGRDHRTGQGGGAEGRRGRLLGHGSAGYQGRICRSRRRPARDPSPARSRRGRGRESPRRGAAPAEIQKAGTYDPPDRQRDDVVDREGRPRLLGRSRHGPRRARRKPPMPWIIRWCLRGRRAGTVSSPSPWASSTSPGCRRCRPRRRGSGWMA